MPGQSADAVIRRNNVRVTGTGDRTILFAHGFGSDQSAWRIQIETFQLRPYRKRRGVATGNPERSQLAGYYEGTLTAIRPDIAQAVLRVIFTSDHRAELSKVKTLVYVRQAQADVAVPSAVGHYPAAHIANSRLVTLQSQGQLPHVSDPNAVNRAIEELLAA